MIRELSVSGAETARNMYNRRGWVAHHNTSIWRVLAERQRADSFFLADGARVVVQPLMGTLPVHTG